jgi:hypothetical protein
MPPKRVAIVAVHGVGHKEPKESARAIARMLSHLAAPGSSDPLYSPFVETEFGILTSPVVVRPDTEQAPREGRLDERPPALRRELSRLSASDGAAQLDPDIAFMREQLRDHKEEGAYESVRLESTRSDGCQVHVFEMYWADLSRLKAGPLRFFFAVYDLLFHLSGLGRKAVDWAALDCPGDRTWARLQRLRRWADRLLAIFIPALNLQILAIALFILAAEALRHFSAPRPWQRPLFMVLACAWVPLAGLVLARIARAYERPGAGAVLLATGVVSTSLFLWATLRSASDPEGFRSGALDAIRLLAAAADACWLALYAALIAAWWVTLRCRLLAEPTPRGERLRAAAHTGTLTSVLATAMFMLVTVGFWVAFVMAAKPFVGGLAYHGTLPALWLSRPSSAHDVGSLAADLARAPTAPFLAAAFVLFLLAAVVGVIGLWPAVRSESVRPDDASTAAMGARLDAGFASLNAAGTIAYVAVALVVPLGSLSALALDAAHLAIATEAARWGAAVAAGLGLLFIGSVLVLSVHMLDALSLQFHLVLDIVLEVEGYLRETPRKRTLRARIAARSVSLLRYLCRADRGYDAIVIVAHSQGGVAVADLLRFLQREPDPSLSRLGRDVPVSLFTMGCPLRQLYAARFPHLYLWARPEAAPAHAAAALPQAAADPAELGLREWVNAYRSADYIGRYLWRSPLPDPWSSEASEDAPGRRRELCVGAGAHLHYWDDWAPQVARELDRLVTSTCLRAERSDPT